MRTDTIQRTASGGRRPWAAQLAIAALALGCTVATYAQVSTYNFSYTKRLQTASVLTADENAAFEPITGGVVLVNGTSGAQGGDVGTGYIWNSANDGTIGALSYYLTNGAPFTGWKGNGVYVGNYQNSTDGDGQFTTAAGVVAKTGPGYTIPFTFTYNGEVFDRVGVSGQGWIGFGKSADGSNAVQVYTSQTASAANLPLSNTTWNGDSRRNRVVAYGVTGAATGSGTGSSTNLIPLPYRSNGPTICASGCHGTTAQQTSDITNYGAPFDNNQYPGAELRYETIGTAPNRVFVVQWLNYGFIMTNSTPTGLQMANRRVSFQIRLYETSNKVEVRFGKAWRGGSSGAGITGAFQTGLGGKTGGTAGVADFSSFGFYNGSDMTTLYWPYAYTNQANHSQAPNPGNYGNTGKLDRRIGWNEGQGYSDPINYGAGTAAAYFAATFKQAYTTAGTPFNNPQNTITNRVANLPDMMGFEWTPNPCTQVASAVTIGSYVFATNSATLSWTGTGNFDYAVGTGIDPSTATITGNTSSNSVPLTGLARSTTYKAWVRTNCGGGQTSQWLLAGSTLATLPCAVPGAETHGYGVHPISRVQISDINNSSTNEAVSYENFLNVVGHLESPLSFPITVEGTSPYGYNVYATAFFDWDGNGTFEDRQEIGSGLTSASGTITVPGYANGNCMMRIYRSMAEVVASACVGPTYGGQTEDYSLIVTPASCVPVLSTSLAVTNIKAQTANLAWAAASGANALGYIWELRTSGSPGSPSPAASGTTALGTTTVNFTTLTQNTTYTFYVRVDCGVVDGQSLWASKSFKTELSCGDAWVSPGGAANLSDVQSVSTNTFCPNNPGDVVTLNFTTWNGLNWNLPNASRIFIYDGDNTSAPMVAGGNGTAYTNGAWSVPAGGWTDNPNAAHPNKPPTTTSSAVSGCLTVKVYNYGTWTSGGGWSAAITCAAPPTCFAPTSRTVTSTAAHTASLSWNPGASPNVEYKVVASGGASSAAAITSGTSNTGSATATGLTANTAYTVYFRGLCSGGSDLSAWSDPGLNFSTKVGCGGVYDLYASTGYPAYTTPKDSTITICPDNAGDVVTLTPSTFLFGWSGNGLVGLLVYDGSSTSAPQFNSGLPAKTSGANTLPAGAFYALNTPAGNGPGYTNTTLPGPFTSSVAGGCLTLRFLAYSSGTYDTGMKSNVTCAAAPACSKPNQVSMSNVGGTTATVSWGNTTNPCIVEYGPVGFTPGTGATAGTNGTVVSGLTSPASVTGLTVTTNYDVYVRQVCGGSTYSANSYFSRLTTSMNCAAAQVITCGASVPNNFVLYVDGNSAYTTASYTGASSCMGSAGAEATGAERLFRFTVTEPGVHNLTIPANSVTKVGYAITPVANGCAASAFTCVGVGLAAGSSLNTASLAAGDYYLMADAHASYSGNQQFSLYCPGIPACVAAPTNPANANTIAVNTNTIAFTWPASFGATGYDIYWNGSATPLTTVATNSITPAGYTTAAVEALVGLGNPVSWRAVPKNAYGTASCPTNWTFRVGGNGAAKAIPLTNGVARNGNRYTTSGYTNLNTATTSGFFSACCSTKPVINGQGNLDDAQNFSGVDSWYTFVASGCADSARVSIKNLGPATRATAMFLLKSNSDTLRLPGTTAAGIYYNLAVGSTLLRPKYNPVTNGYDYSVPTWKVTPGQRYYVVVDGYAAPEMDFEVKYNEVLQTADFDNDGLLDCADECPAFPGVNGSPCNAGPLYTSGMVVGCACVGQNPLPCTNNLRLEFQTDESPWETSWQIVHQATGVVVRAGGPLNAPEGVETSDFCLPNGCYYLRVLDDAGDGMTTGGYILRTQGTNLRLIDNRNNFSDGSESVISGNQAFCLPIGTDRVINTNCDKVDWVESKYIVATENAAVSAQYGVTNATSGYEFWFFDPNGSYSFRRFRNHATTDGYGSGATRACHFRINSWTASVATPWLPSNILLNVRIRGRVAGTNLEFGPACRFKIDPVLAACPRTSLQDNADNTADYSCGVSRTFGGSNSGSNKVVANPPQFVPNNVLSGNVRYQFRFRIPGEYPAAGSCIVRPVQTSPTLYLNWTTGDKLKCNTQYEVDVRVSKDAGATWCTANSAATCDSPSNIQLWGKVCKVNITTSTYCTGGAQGGASNLSEQNGGELTMYPNPNRGDQVFINLSKVDNGTNTVSVDIFDLTGKKVTARTIAVQDGFVKATLDLNNDLSNGIYLVSITAGSKAYTERLVIQH
jgi:hypothetical protein